MFEVISKRIKNLNEFEKLDFLKRHHILTHYPYELPLQTQLLKEQMIFSQKKQNLIFLQEIENLAMLAKNNDIPLLFFKGVCLAKDIYLDFDNRLTGDVDVLIMPKDLSKFLHIIEEQGGYKKFSFNIEQEANKHITGRGGHFTALDKEVFFEGIKYIFHLEIHIRVTTIELHDHSFTSIQDEFNLTEQIINRARTFCLNLSDKSIDVRVMDIHDSLMFMIIHMIKHLLWDLTRTTFQGGLHFFNMQLILDLINFWLKYKYAISLTVLRSRIKEFDVLNTFLLGVQIVKNFYQDFLGDMFENMTPIDTGNHSITAGFLRNLFNLNINNIVFLPSDVLVGKILNSKKFVNECVTMVNKQPIEKLVFSLEPNGVCYNSKGEKIFTDIKMLLKIGCNLQGLECDIKVFSKNFVFENACLNDMYLCDTVQLNIISRKANETGRYDSCFRLCFEDTPSGYLKDCSKQEWTNIRKQVCSVNVVVDSDGYSAKFIVPWQVLGVEYNQEDVLLVNLGIHHYDVNREECIYLTHNTENRCFGYNSIFEYMCIKM